MADAKNKQKPSLNQEHNEERSVEDILASIRKMIADEIDTSEGNKVGRSPLDHETSNMIDQNSEVGGYKDGIGGSNTAGILELTTEVDENGNIVSSSNVGDRRFSEEEKSSKDDEDKPLLTETSENVAIDAFTYLASEIRAIDENGGSKNNSTTNPTLEDVIKTILKPMLREWLDKNLDHIVRSLVQTEIERISARSRKK